MSSNKIDEKLDFSNVKQTQLDKAQVLKGAFSELMSSLRVYKTNPILKDAYTHFSQTVNGDGQPTYVEYWQANDNSVFNLSFTSDSSGSLAGEYIVYEEFLTKKTIALYTVVSGSGTAPGIADEEYPVNINTNDPAAIVRSAHQAVLNSIESLKTKNENGFLSTALRLECLQFGPSTPIDVSNSSYSLVTLKTGDSFKVGEVYLEYDANKHPIYNGNVLKGLLYNPYTASFDVERDEIEVSAVVSLDPLISKNPAVYNVNMPLAGTEYSLTFPLTTKRFEMSIRDNASSFTFSWTSGGAYITKTRGNSYTEEGLEIIAGKDTIYFTGLRNNLVMEILAWD